LIDPYHGQRDLAQKILRHVSPAFAEDPLRILRVARFAARYGHLGFRIAPETLALMRAIVDAGEVEHLVSERIWKETERALGEKNPEIYFQTLQQCAALPRLMPQLRSDDLALAELKECAAQHQTPLVRFAVLGCRLDIDKSAAFCARICAPNDYRELLQLALAQLPALTSAKTPDATFAVIEQSDALRRPQRFALLLEVAAALKIDDAQLARFRDACKNAATITAQPLLEKGFQGKQLGEQLRRERLAAIERGWI
jgi:tRNA nucleotidyltransferase (CCA-adding enzyme)